MARWRASTSAEAVTQGAATAHEADVADFHKEVLMFFAVVVATILVYCFGYFMGWIFTSTSYERLIDRDCKILQEKFDSLEDVMNREG